MGIFMLIFGLPFLILLFVIPIWLFDRYNKKENTDSALEILKKRFALGEINKKEFEEKKKMISIE